MSVRLRDLSQAGLFGLIDGLNGMVGLVIGLSREHAAPALILTALLARAGSSAVSMAGAQYESDDAARPRAIRRADKVKISEAEAAQLREGIIRALREQRAPVILPPDDRPQLSAALRWGKIAAMGGGYLASALLPGLGFAFGYRAGWEVFVPSTVAVLAAVTWFRSGTVGWVKAAVTTIVIFVLAVGAGLLASLAG